MDFFFQRWEILTDSAAINGSDTCVCFIRHMQSPRHDPNIHYFGFLSLLFKKKKVMMGSLFSQRFVLYSTELGCFSVSCTSLIRKCQAKETPQGMEEGSRTALGLDPLPDP